MNKQAILKRIEGLVPGLSFPSIPGGVEGTPLEFVNVPLESYDELLKADKQFRQAFIAAAVNDDFANGFEVQRVSKQLIKKKFQGIVHISSVKLLKALGDLHERLTAEASEKRAAKKPVRPPSPETVLGT